MVGEFTCKTGGNDKGKEKEEEFLTGMGRMGRREDFLPPISTDGH